MVDFKKKERDRRYRATHKEEVRERGRLWAQKDRTERPERQRETSRRWYERHYALNPERNRKKRLARRGLTPEQYDLMSKGQGGVCAICAQAEREVLPSGKLKPLSVDHCHRTNEIRGLLCSECNKLLGHARDSIKTLQSAIEYLSR